MKILQTWCCWGTDYCKCECLGLSRNQNIKVAYISLILLMLIVTSIVAKYAQTSALVQLLGCDHNTSVPDKQSACVSEKLSFRWFLGLAFMHFILIILVALRSQVSKIFNEGAWFVKLIFIIAVGFLFMYAMPNGVLYALQVGFAYLSPLWYLFQSLIIIDMIYSFDISLKEAADRNGKMHILKALLSILSVIGAVVINVLSYTNFANSQLSLWVPILNSIHLGVYLLVVLFRLVKGNTLLVFGLVMLYENVLGYYIRYPAQDYSNTLFPAIQTALVVISLLGILSPGTNKVRTKKSSLNQILALNTSREEEDNRYVSSNKWIVFHLVFFLICGIVTWIIYQQGESFEYEEHLTNLWMDRLRFFRIVGWYMVIVIYFWTLVAARMFPEQDFDQLQNYFKQFELN